MKSQKYNVNEYSYNFIHKLVRETKSYMYSVRVHYVTDIWIVWS